VKLENSTKKEIPMTKTRASTLTVRLMALRGLLALMVAALPIFACVPTTQAASPAAPPADVVLRPPAQSGTGGDGETGGGGAIDAFQARLLNMAKTIIKLILFLGAIVLAIAVPKGALMAQVNNLFGSATGVSHAWMNILAAVVAGGVCLMSMPLVDLIFKLFVPDGNIPINIPVPGF
jgi:hypothetical protein